MSKSGANNNIFKLDVDRRFRSPGLVCDVVKIFDFVIIFLLSVLVFWIYWSPPTFSVPNDYLIATVMACVASFVIFDWLGVYEREAIFSDYPRVSKILIGWVLASFFMLAIAFGLKISDNFSRGWAIGWFVAVPVALSVSRLALCHYLRQLSADGRFALRTVILGAGEMGQRLASSLKTSNDFFTNVLGFIDDRKTRVPSLHEGYRILGNTDDLIDMIRKQRVQQVLIALPWSAEKRLEELIDRISATPANVLLVPDTIGQIVGECPVQVVHGTRMYRILEVPLTGWRQVGKFVEDRFIATCLLLLTLPLVIFIGASIRFESPGPIFLRDRRFGYNKEEILIWRFRTTYVEPAVPDAAGGAPRFTMIGYFLERSGLSELPLIFNVLRGDMSIVGPRPHPVAMRFERGPYNKLVNRYDARHSVKPGLTGWAQVNCWNKFDTLENIEESLEYDLFYIRNWSIWLDFMIILRTIATIWRSDQKVY